MTNRIYLDNAATTRVTEPVAQAMLPFLTEVYGNPSSIHSFGREARRAVEAARTQVANAIGAQNNEIYFTAGGTEADNWAIRGAAHARKDKGRHIITSSIEHHASLHACESLEKEGFELTYLPVDEYGMISVGQLEAAIRPDTILITLIAANNEIGTIQPVEEIGKLARDKRILFHADAVQAVGKIPVNVDAWGVDMLSLSAHKFHGPKGVGALYIRSGTRINPLIVGGAQERAQRAGTENVACIVGLGVAIERATKALEHNNAVIAELRDRLEQKILDRVSDVKLNGHPTQRVSNITNLSFRYIEGESILLNLDMKGVAASTGSACASGSLDPSHVMLAIGLSHERAHGSVRFSFSEENTTDEVDRAVEIVKEAVERLRAMSPLYTNPNH